MAHISLIVDWLRRDIERVEAQHESYRCQRCDGRGFRFCRWFPCRICAGTGFPRVNLREAAHRMRGYIDLIEARLQSDGELLAQIFPAARQRGAPCASMAGSPPSATGATDTSSR